MQLAEEIATVEGELAAACAALPDSDLGKAAASTTVLEWRIGTLDWLSDRLLARDDMTRAVAVLRSSAAATTEAFGPDHWRTRDARLAVAAAERRASFGETERRRLSEADRHLTEATSLQDAGRPNEAVPRATAGLEIRRQLLGENDRDYCRSVSQLAGLLSAAGRFTEAERLYQQSVRIARSAFGERHPGHATALNDLAIVSGRLGRPAEAEALYERALEIYMEVDDERIPGLASCLNNLGLLYLETARYEDAEPLLRRALTLRESAVPRDDGKVANSLSSLAGLLSDTGRHAEAGPLLENAREVTRASAGESHPDYARCLSNLASNYQATGRYAEAEPLYKESVEIRRRTLSERHPDYAIGLNNLANFYIAAGRHAEAEPLLTEALRVTKAALGDRHADYALCLGNLAGVRLGSGRYDEAEPLFLEQVAVLKTAVGTGHPAYATALQNLGSLFYLTGRFAEAESSYRDALDAVIRASGKRHEDYTRTLSNLALLLSAQGRHAESEPLLKEAVRTNETQYGSSSPQFASSLAGLGGFYIEVGDYTRAEAHLRQASELMKGLLGEAHPDYARNLDRVAFVCAGTGRFREAEELYEECLRVLGAVLGEDHPDYAHALSNLAVVYVATGRPRTALEIAERTCRTTRRHQATFLSALSDREQLGFLGQGADLFRDAAVSVALTDPEGPESASRSLACVLNLKAVAVEALTERTRLAAASSDPSAAATVRELSRTRSDLARLTLAGAKAGGEQFSQLARLVQREADLAKSLHLYHGEDARGDPWVAAEEVRAALPTDAVLVEFLRYRTRFTAGWKWGEPPGEARLAAWVVPPVGLGDVRLIDLGPADAIDAAVSEALAAVATHGEADSHAKLTGLAAAMMRPLEPHISSADRWFISPDGALWLVPFAALPLADGGYVVERHEVTLLSSGRDLATDRKARSGGATGGLIVADPDFGRAGPSAAPNRLGSFDPRLTSTTRAALADLGTFPSLPGTAAEAAAVKPILSAYLAAAPEMRLGRQATEAVVKAAKGPKVMVLATHGFALTAESERNRRPEGGRPLRGLTPHAWSQAGSPALENPLLRCGLAFAGANSREGGAGEDGILTGLEVAGLNLRETDLVVLSACRTAVGDVRAGEGVADLRHAFRLAGAGAVVASLWDVPDAETSSLMVRFWEEMSRGRPPSTSLRAAQLKLLAELRDRGDARPGLWAAFSVTGPRVSYGGRHGRIGQPDEGRRVLRSEAEVRSFPMPRAYKVPDEWNDRAVLNQARM